MSKRYNPFSYAHMCRSDHVQIGHDDSEHEQCPLCRTLHFLEILLGHDERFQIAIGGNPIAVDRMLSAARQTFADVGCPAQQKGE